MSELNSWNDANGDGIGDSAEFDTDGNGIVDGVMLDQNFDGRIDVVAVDENENGAFEAVGVDTDRDGDLDSIGVDRNDNGVIDVVSGQSAGGRTVEVGDAPSDVQATPKFDSPEQFDRSVGAPHTRSVMDGIFDES
jgi:hypothetical protein